MVFYRENWNYWINAGEMFRVKAFLEDRCSYLFQDKDTVVEAIGIRVPAGVERDKFVLWNGNAGMTHVHTTVIYRFDEKRDGWNRYNDTTLGEYLAEIDRYSDKKYEWVFLGE